MTSYNPYHKNCGLNYIHWHFYKLTKMFDNLSNPRNSSDIIYNETDMLNALSLQWMYLQRPTMYFWITDALLNISAAIFLLCSLRKWKIYEGDVWFLTQSMLLSEILSCIYAIGIAVSKLVYSYNGWPDVVTRWKCHFSLAGHISVLTVCAWFNFWISIDRFLAIVKPKLYDLR